MGAAAELDEDAIPAWQVAGEWFDVCSCYVPCPCTFAQPPTNNACEVLFAYRINEGHFGETPMKGLKVVILASLVGNVWAGAKLDAGVIFDASADDRQRRGLELIFTGKAGGWMGQFTQTIRTVTGVAYADISVEIDRSLERWHVAVPDLVDAGGIAPTGPTADPTKRVQTFNAPGSEVGPTDAPVTWGKSVTGRRRAFGFDQDLPAGRNSKHMPFAWSGPDPQ